jgi:hypothetical protein
MGMYSAGYWPGYLDGYGLALGSRPCHRWHHYSERGNYAEKLNGVGKTNINVWREKWQQYLKQLRGITN